MKIEAMRELKSAADQPVIRYYRKNVWGNVLCYPVDYAAAIFDLTGQVTLTKQTFNGLTELGYKFVEVLESSVKQGGGS